jgi:uncharacterized protein YcgI (DUF1989 family)
VLDPAPAAPRTHVDLQAELDLFVSVANVPHSLDTRDGYTCTPLRLTAWADGRRPATTPSTPEVERAYLNNDDWLAGTHP